MTDYAEELALYLHDDFCEWADARHRREQDCRKDHKGYYHEKARTLLSQLEPLIGLANVLPAVRIVIEEVT